MSKIKIQPAFYDADNICQLLNVSRSYFEKYVRRNLAACKWSDRKVAYRASDVNALTDALWKGAKLDMTRYQYLEKQILRAEEKARAHENDMALHNFWLNASEGYKLKKARLSVAEAQELVLVNEQLADLEAEGAENE